MSHFLFLYFMGIVSLGFGQTSFFQQEEFGLNPGNLKLYLYVPQTLSENPSLLVVLHGCSQNATSFSQESGWNELAESNGFIVLYPEQRYQNNASLCFNWYADGSPCESDELRSIQSMVKFCTTRYGIDTQKQFVYGVSAGAAMAVQLMVCQPDQFKAGASVAGGAFVDVDGLTEAGKLMRRKEAISDAHLLAELKPFIKEQQILPDLIVYHGTSDKVVNEQNTKDLIQQWTLQAGIAQNPQTQQKYPSKKGDINKRCYRSESGVRLVWYQGNAMGHWLPLGVWEEGRPIPKKSPLARDIGFHLNFNIAKDMGLITHETK